MGDEVDGDAAIAAVEAWLGANLGHVIRIERQARWRPNWLVDAGIERASAPECSGWLGLSRFEALYRAQKIEPDPFLEFALGWVHRHPPRSQPLQTFATPSR